MFRWVEVKLYYSEGLVIDKDIIVKIKARKNKIKN